MKKKAIALIMAFAMLISTGWFDSNVKAAEDSKIKLSFNAPLPAPQNAVKIDPSSAPETILGDDSTNVSKLLTSKNVDILSEYGIDAKDVKSVKKIKDNRNDRTVSEVRFSGKSAVGFDADNNIVSISNFKNRSGVSKTNSGKSVADEVYSDETVSVDPIASDSDETESAEKVSNGVSKAIISTIETNSGLKDGYKLVSSEAFDDDYWQLEWQKYIGNGILNPYDSLKVVIDRSDNTVVVYNRFNMTPDATEAVISEEEALSAGQPILDAIGNAKNTSVSLTVTRPNHFWNEGGPYEEDDTARLAYKISINDGAYAVYIDSVTGENLGGDMLKVRKAKAFAWAGFDYASESAYLAKSGMGSFGYSTLSSWVGSGSEMGTAITDFWDGSSSYGFYVDCHGSPTTIGDNDTWELSTDDVSGNWKFVFLDACKTAKTTDWAEAFNVYGHSNRAFLGWKKNVAVPDAYDFCSYFWYEAVNQNHSDNIRDAAVWAASQCSGSTPIKFYGDTSYDRRV